MLGLLIASDMRPMFRFRCFFLALLSSKKNTEMVPNVGVGGGAVENARQNGTIFIAPN